MLITVSLELELSFCDFVQRIKFIVFLNIKIYFFLIFGVENAAIFRGNFADRAFSALRIATNRIWRLRTSSFGCVLLLKMRETVFETDSISDTAKTLMILNDFKDIFSREIGGLRWVESGMAQTAS